MANENANHQYLALTIGPVIKTLLQARKTRELWAASYLLSSLMKYLVQHLDPLGHHLLIPKIPTVVQNTTLFGAGIYPDRLFMEADHLDEAVVETAINAGLNDLTKECLLKQESTDVTEFNAALSFWKQFFRIRYVLHQVKDIKEGHLSKTLSPFLDSLELEDTGFSEETARNYLLHLFEPNRLFNVPLIEGLKAKNRGRYDPILKGGAVFPSTSDIASFELYQDFGSEIAEIKRKHYDEINETHEVFYQALAQHPAIGSKFEPRHKYFCIVQADGDNIGEAIKQLNDRADYIRFSETLATYGAKAAGIINDYGGKPIYIGGDDLLFLAPVRAANESVFDLIEKLDQAFPRKDLHPKASLSFGINIVYYKFPLFEAIGDAYGILKKAKDYTRIDGQEKNSLSFQFTKHSGSQFSSTFSKTFFSTVIDTINTLAHGRSSMVSSLIFKLLTLEKLLTDLANNLAKKAPGDFAHRLDDTLLHFFNEWENVPDFIPQKDAVKNLLIAAHLECGVQGNWLKLSYSVLRLIQFMISSSEKTLSHDPENIAETAA